MILATAWKNVWRNKTRSMVVIASVTVGIFAGVFAVGLMNGTMEQRVESALNEEISFIQINQKEFRDNLDMKLTLNNVEDMSRKISALDGVESLSNRVVLNGIANTATKSVGIQIVGVDPEEEKKVFSLYEETIPGTGSFFEEDSRNNLVYIGEDLAKELNIIRYRIDESTLDSLKSMGIPENVVAKLASLENQRFPSQKAFRKSLKNTLSLKESSKYGLQIQEAAWSFRQRSKLTLTFLDKNNYQTGAMFRIAGVYDVKNSMFEKAQVFVMNSDLKTLTGLDEKSAHISIVRISDRDQTKEITEEIRELFPDLQVQNWKELSPDLAMMTAMIEKFNAVFMIIILAALSFGIVNTMLMVVLERTKELGMLTAIGMNKKRVFAMIMSESVFLSLVGGILGMIVSGFILLLSARNGINFQSSAEGFEAMGFSAHIYPSVNAVFFIETTLLIIITGILASVYPALKALKLDPADALRTE